MENIAVEIFKNTIIKFVIMEALKKDQKATFCSFEKFNNVMKIQKLIFNWHVNTKKNTSFLNLMFP